MEQRNKGKEKSFGPLFKSTSGDGEVPSTASLKADLGVRCVEEQ
ncbi:hypothetical protein ES332_D13G123800v1 [Gossypium tomentosum]|uniref:Uncharacterized protein n=1 Tax=Gossypium tomentosum TaxID=34277 RepID=A0A5D2HW12_GOSTO|nr:hypothetical protein ES332_D13G123800v1 [Gossypium tomentosum]